MGDLDTDVLVVGAGGCGLSSSIFLSDHGVDHLLVERHPSTSHMPKAHYLNTRTMEIFRQHGFAEEVYAKGMPLEQATVRYATTFGGDGPLDRKEIFAFDAFGGNSLRERYEKAGPGMPTNLPQIRLEPLLRGVAESRAPEGRIVFGREVVSYEQDPGGVSVRLRESAGGEESELRVRYLIGADGGKTVGPGAGFVLEGPGPLANLQTFHCTIDLSDHIPGDALITHLTHPGGRFQWLALVQMGPTWGKRCEEWSVAFAFRPEDRETLGVEEAYGAIREAMRLPDLELEIHRGGEWLVERVVADRFRDRRVFVAGDAAHRHVPTNGLGLNSAVHDAHNLCWKLAAVLRGECEDPERLLSSYEDERRPVDLANADWALFTFFNHQMIDAGLGTSPPAPPEADLAAFEAYFSDSPMGETLRERAKAVMGTQRTEYEAIAIDFGPPIDPSTAILADGTPPPPRDPMGAIYTQATRPGCVLPHAWLEGPGGRVSTHDLVGAKAGFLLLTGTAGEPWREAAAGVAARLGIELRVAAIGDGAEYADPSGAWREVVATGPDGAILVRPDNYVAHRVPRLPADPAAELGRALAHVLSRAPGGEAVAGAAASG